MLTLHERYRLAYNLDMERVKKQTRREEWTEFSNLVQEDVNQVLEEAQLEVDVANLKLAELYHSDPEAAGEAVTDIIEYLDDNWGYSGDYFHITGKWHEPMVGINDEGVLVRLGEKEAFHAVRSNGFMVHILEDEEGNERPVVGLSFIVADVPLATSSIQGEFQILGFAEPRDISMQYMRPGEGEVVSSELSEVGDTIMRADALLRLYITHQHSAFYKQTAKKQEKFFRSIIDQVDAVLPAPDSYDQVMVNDATTNRLYMKLPGESRLTRLDTKSGGQFTVSGPVVGVTMSDVVDNGFGKRYKSPNEVAMASEGLSLIVQPHALNFDPPGDTLGDLIIPIGDIDTLQLSME